MSLKDRIAAALQATEDLQMEIENLIELSDAGVSRP